MLPVLTRLKPGEKSKSKLTHTSEVYSHVQIKKTRIRLLSGRSHGRTFRADNKYWLPAHPMIGLEPNRSRNCDVRSCAAGDSRSSG
jgi:hypothetical protein